MSETPELWTALYLPASEWPSPSKFDFTSRDEAEQYMFSNMCSICREERRRKLSGESDPGNEQHEHDSEWPPCSCEWAILKTKEWLECEDFSDVMDAVGAKVIWRRDENGTASSQDTPLEAEGTKPGEVLTQEEKVL